MTTYVTLLELAEAISELPLCHLHPAKTITVLKPQTRNHIVRTDLKPSVELHFRKVTVEEDFGIVSQHWALMGIEPATLYKKKDSERRL